jgi:hypothetical protein
MPLATSAQHSSTNPNASHQRSQAALPHLIAGRTSHSFGTLSHAESDALSRLFGNPHSAFVRDASNVDRTYFGVGVTVMRAVDLADSHKVGLGWEGLIAPAEHQDMARVNQTSDVPGVETSCRANPSWTVVNHTAALVASWGAGGHTLKAMTLDRPTKISMTQKLLRQVLPHVTLDGRPIGVEQVRPWGHTFFWGSPLPVVHRDFQWSAFGDAAGFQAWCLVRNRRELGNLVLVEHAEAPTEHKHPVYFATFDEGADEGSSSTTGTEGSERAPTDKEEEGVSTREATRSRLLKLNHITNELHEEYATWREAPLRFKYPKLRPGQCILMHRSQLHASDPRFRPEFEREPNDRLSFTVRFIVLRTPKSPLRIWLNNGYPKRFASTMFAGGAQDGKPRCRLHANITGWCVLREHRFDSFL